MFKDIWNTIIAFSFTYLRLILKWFLRKTTGLCELQRICYATEKGAKRCIQLEKSIIRSKSKIIKKIHNSFNNLSIEMGMFSEIKTNKIFNLVECAVEAICADKEINQEIHQEFLNAMQVSILQIYGYKQLIFEINNLKSISYNSQNSDHEMKLLKIWNNLMPDNPLKSRISKQWIEIGFQGNDPKTDFRGMGSLGLENLLYFTTKYQSAARNILSHSNHPVNGYPFAITGINITHIAYLLLINEKLKTHFYNSYFSMFNINHFHQAYCYLFFLFDKIWIREKPKDVMEFRHIKEKFLSELNQQLLDDTFQLKWEPLIEAV